MASLSATSVRWVAALLCLAGATSVVYCFPFTLFATGGVTRLAGYALVVGSVASIGLAMSAAARGSRVAMAYGAMSIACPWAWTAIWIISR